MEAVVLDRKKGVLPSAGRWGAPASGGGLQVSQGVEGEMEREMDRPIGAVSAVSAVAVPTCDPLCAKLVLHTSVTTSIG